MLQPIKETCYQTINATTIAIANVLGAADNPPLAPDEPETEPNRASSLTLSLTTTTNPLPAIVSPKISPRPRFTPPSIMPVRVRNHGQMCNTQILIVLDLSRSMTKSLENYNEFFTKGFPTIINNQKPELNNQAFLMCFAGKTVYPPQPFYTPNEIASQVANLRHLITSGTPLFMAIDRGLAYLDSIKDPHMVQQLHIHTDGLDSMVGPGETLDTLINDWLWKNPEHREELIRTRSAITEKMHTFLSENPQSRICFYSYINNYFFRSSPPEEHFNKYGKPTLADLREKFPLRISTKTIDENYPSKESSLFTTTSRPMGETATALTDSTSEAALPPICFAIDQTIPKDFTYSYMLDHRNLFYQDIYYKKLYHHPLSFIEEWGLTTANYREKSIQLNNRELPEEEKLALIEANADKDGAQIIDIIERNAP